MNKPIISLLLLLLSPVAMQAQTVEQDKSFLTGKLSNGLTYYIRHNDKEKGIADFYIAQRVGSILEEPRQRGLAHFLEHMAFNGSQNFRGTKESPSIVPWCESHGVKFGANLNAYTSVDETVYHVSAVPVTKESVIDSTLLILHDWSHYLLLTDEEIDKERGVIHEEWRSRRSGMAAQRLMEEVLPIVYKGSKYEDCLPIGSMDIVDHFPYNDLRDYYNKWYRPDLQAIIVVGDIDVGKMQQRITAMFDTIPMPKNPARREYYPVPDNGKMIVAVKKDAEQPIMLATLYMKRDATPDKEKNTVAYQRDGYMDQLMSYIVGERLDQMQKAAVPPCLSASSRNGEFFISRTKDAFALSFGVRQDNVRGSFDAAVGVVERVRQHGFTAGELDRAKAFVRKYNDRLYNNRLDRRNSWYVRRAQRNFLDFEPLLSAETQKQLADQFDAEVTLNELNSYMKTVITDRNQVLVVYAPDKPEFQVPSEAGLEQYVTEAQARTYEPYADGDVPTELISHEPKAGTIVAEKPYAHGATELTLSNGVKVYFKQTDYDKDNLTLRFWGEGGTSLYPDADVPNFSFISTAIQKAGVGDFDDETLGKILAGKTVRLQPAVGDETQAISGFSALKDAKSMFQLLYLYFTSPRRDDTAFQGEMNRMRSFLTNREASPRVTYNDSIVAIVYGNSPRVQPVKLKTLDRVNYDRILQIYKERFSNAGNFKMILIGNISLDSIRPLLCRYVASLPSTGKTETFAKTYPQVQAGDATHLFHRAMKTPTANVSIFYSWQEPYNSKTDLDLDVLQRVLQIAYTDSVREEKGGVYGVSVSASCVESSTPTTLMKISFTCDPNRYDELIPVVYRQVQNIAERGPLDSSLDKVKKYLTKQYGQATITNDYWNYVLYNLLRHNVDFDDNYLDMVEAVSPADIQQMAARLLQAKRRIEVTMLPE